MQCDPKERPLLPDGLILTRLPGGSIVQEGLDHLSRNLRTIPAQLLLVGGPRLRRLGLNIPFPAEPPEHFLYHLLWESNPNSAHSRYNALIRLLVRSASKGQQNASSRRGGTTPGIHNHACPRGKGTRPRVSYRRSNGSVARGKWDASV
jgi:hypothetical protein